ncbi:MAG: hypothetical protein P1U53_16410 [Sulfitobacter sp.]|nr:hypothetical protein [Sulfitobacter sp.]
MTQKIDIPANEQGTSRLFALSLSEGAATELRDDAAAQAQLLGIDRLDPAGTEVFPLKDLGEMGLEGYLREGIDARDEDITRDRGRLRALEGWVMLVHSLAFDGEPVTLRPSPSATLIGTYAQQEVPVEPAVPIDSDAARPYSGVPRTEPVVPPKGGAGGATMVIGIVLLILLVLWWVLS